MTTHLRYPVLFSLLASLFILPACSSSSVITRPLNVPAPMKAGIVVAPIAAPAKELVGIKSTTIIHGNVLSDPIIVGFTWDQQDCENLRQSIVASLRAGTPASAPTGAAYELQVQLQEAGITRMDLPTCRITGKATLKKDGTVVATHAFNIRAMVLSAVSTAKNKAIKDLLGEIESLLQSAR